MKIIRNVPNVEFTPLFNKHLRKSTDEIKVAFEDMLALFLEDSAHPHLRNHALGKKLTGYRSIDVTGDWRAVFKEKKIGTQKTIIFHMIGTHMDLYK